MTTDNKNLGNQYFKGNLNIPNNMSKIPIQNCFSCVFYERVRIIYIIFRSK